MFIKTDYELGPKENLYFQKQKSEHNFEDHNAENR